LLTLTAIYAILSLFWTGFADWVAPGIIVAAYNGRSLSVLNWVFEGHTSLSIGHYLDRWSVTAAALQIAMILHLALVLFIVRIDLKHRVRLPNTPGSALNFNFVLIAFSAAFLALTALSWVRADYPGYVDEWTGVLAGRDPWPSETPRKPFNAYGPLFNVLAPLVWLNPLANKLLFALLYLAYVVWLIKDFAPRRGFVTISWPWLGLWLLNPFPWVEIAYLGYSDVLVALTCVAAVHSLLDGKDRVSGTYLALGILLKFMPIVILPFLVFSERRFHVRLLGFCIGVVVFGFSVSVVVWGTSTFLPLTFAMTRYPYFSIYDVFASTKPLDWLEKPLLVTGGLGVFAWCVLRRTGPTLSAALAVSITLLFYRLGYINYYMVPFFLILYWVVSHWEQSEAHPVLSALLAGCFALLAFADLVHWTMGQFYSSVIVFKFLLGLGLLVGLAQFSVKPSLTSSFPEHFPRRLNRRSSHAERI
jgi:hypothetical protein